MKTLIAKLQKEAGLTLEQANKAVELFRKYLVDNKKDPDLTEALKIKTIRATNKAKVQYDKAEHKIEDWTDKMENKADVLVGKAKKKAKKVVDKLSDYLED